MLRFFTTQNISPIKFDPHVLLLTANEITSRTIFVTAS